MLSTRSLSNTFTVAVLLALTLPYSSLAQPAQPPSDTPQVVISFAVAITISMTEDMITLMSITMIMNETFNIPTNIVLIMSVCRVTWKRTTDWRLLPLLLPMRESPMSPSLLLK